MSDAQTWDLWYPNAAARGLPFARGRLDATDVLLVHASPDTLDVDVLSDGGYLIARGRGLKRTASRPMARLAMAGGTITQVDCWPKESDIGRPVILPGGEIGILLAWWNTDDGSDWRWRVEFYNRQRRPGRSTDRD